MRALFLIFTFCLGILSPGFAGQEKDREVSVLSESVGTVVTFKAKNKTGQYIIENKKGVYKNKSGDFQMSIQYDEKKDLCIIEVKGKTEGWVAVGFGQTKMMKDAEIIIGYVKEGKPALFHHYATGWVKHEPIEKLDKNAQKDTLKVIKAEEKDGWTTITFSRPVGLKGDYFKDLRSGKMINFMYSLGKDDSLMKKHFRRGEIKIKLP
ncbi:MAG: hypothetical protein KKH98_05235 [Spirochaetes bacterium]|nr:hypothetical protein [Spirochaetota bacterium]